jgi:uncharacterized glyoxalase superfamily protein PhnB
VITPHIVVDDAASAADWYTRVLGAEEGLRVPAPGAEVFQPLRDTFWGERYGQVIDPFGHRWGLAQHLRDVSGEEILRGAEEMFAGTDYERD